MIYKNSVLLIDILWVIVLELEVFYVIFFVLILVIYFNLCDKYCNDILFVYVFKLLFIFNKIINFWMVFEFLWFWLVVEIKLFDFVCFEGRLKWISFCLLCGIDYDLVCCVINYVWI